MMNGNEIAKHALDWDLQGFRKCDRPSKYGKHPLAKAEGQTCSEVKILRRFCDALCFPYLNKNYVRNNFHIMI